MLVGCVLSRWHVNSQEHCQFPPPLLTIYFKLCVCVCVGGGCYCVLVSVGAYQVQKSEKSGAHWVP